MLSPVRLLPAAPKPATPLPRTPASGAELIKKARLASRQHGEATAMTWDDVTRGQKRLETMMKFNVVQKVVQQKPVWWKPHLSSSVLDDARRFEQRREKGVHHAVTTLRGAQSDPADRLTASGFDGALASVRRERLIGQWEGLAGDFLTAKDRAARNGPKKRKRWRRAFAAVAAKPKDLESIFAPRAKQSDSKSTLDTFECMERCLNHDWEHALYYGIGDYIMSWDDDNDESEIEEIRLMLLSNVWLVYSAFDYLASLGDARGSTSVLSISLNAFSGFIKDAKLADAVSSNCKNAHLDQLFILINSLEPKPATRPASPTRERATPTPPPEMLEVPKKGGDGCSGSGAVATASKWGKAKLLVSASAGGDAPTTAATAKWDKAKQLVVKTPQHIGGNNKIGLGNARTFERHEWIHSLVRIAIMRYVLPGERSVPQCADVSEALEMLLMNDIKANLPEELSQKSNDFRTRFCYTDGVEASLRKNKSSLMAIFTAFSGAERTHDPGKLQIGERMGMDDWLDLCALRPPPCPRPPPTPPRRARGGTRREAKARCADSRRARPSCGSCQVQGASNSGQGLL